MGDMAVALSESEPLVEPAPHRFTVDEFNALADSGALGREPRVELVDGVVIDVPPGYPPHAGNVAAFLRFFIERFGRRACVRPQLSLPVSTYSQPEPDIALVRWDPGFYRDRHPGPADTLAVVEISYTSLSFDRTTKKRVYGAAGIAEYWIVDVRGDAIEIHRGAHDLGYRDATVARRGDAVGFAALPDVTFTVDELLG